MKSLMIAAACGALWAGSANALDLHLRCDGTATVPRVMTTTASVENDAGDAASGESTTIMGRDVRVWVLFEITDAGARIRLPRAMLPPINTGGSDGWWPVSDLSVSDTEIGGRFKVNVLNRPTVRVDRVSGQMELKGMGRLDFRGDCSIEDPAARKF